MAITTYAELQTAIDNWVDHQLFSARSPDFITLFESTVNRRLRVRQQETSTTLTPSAGSATLPTDYLSWRQATWMGSTPALLEYVEPDYLDARFPTITAGTPKMFTIEGSTFRIGSSDTTGITFKYFAKVPSLSDSATTNWLLTAHPDLYLFGSLVEAEMFGVNDERAPAWKARRDEIFDEIERLSNKTRGSGAIKIMSVTP
jgi:hypothetical protein